MAKAPLSSVSALQEFCAKNNIPFPVYTIIADDECGFICKVEVMDKEEMGNGRSKRDAKHLAANAVLKRLKLDGETSDHTTMFGDSTVNVTMPPVDMVKTLRDFCVQNEHPLPTFELVAQFGTPNAPRFTILCQIASIKQYATSDKKKDAKQRAAFLMHDCIQDKLVNLQSELEMMSLDSKIKSEMDDHYFLFKSYHDLIESGTNPLIFGLRLDERHMTYTRFYAELKNAAQEVLNEDYESVKTQTFDLLDALQLYPKICKMPSVGGSEMLFIEISCKGIDTCFSGFENDIYREIILYFRTMLD